MIKESYRLKMKILLFIFLIFQTLNISAQEGIPDSLVKARIKSIQNILIDGKKNTNRWWYGWLTGYSAGTIGQGVIYFQSNDKSTRQDMALGAVTCFVGAAGQLITPLNPGKKADILAQFPDSTEEVRFEKLSKAEEMLKSIADTEKAGRSWKTHALYSAINLGSGLITWLGFKRTVWAGLGNFAMNTVITEAQIWTQPTRTMKDYEEYCRRYESDISELICKSKPKLYVSAFPGGIVIRLLF